MVAVREDICLGFMTWYGVTFGCWGIAMLIGSAYIRWRFRDRARALTGAKSCPRCGATSYAGCESRRQFPCPQCGEHAMQVVIVGMS